MNRIKIAHDSASMLLALGLIFVPVTASAVTLKDCQSWLETAKAYFRPEPPKERHGRELVRLGFKRFEKTNFYQKHTMTVEVIDGQAPRLWVPFFSTPAKTIWSLARTESKMFKDTLTLKIFGKDHGQPSSEEKSITGSGQSGGSSEAVHNPADKTLRQQLLRAGFVQDQLSANQLSVTADKDASVVALLAPNGQLRSLLKPVKYKLDELVDGSAIFSGYRTIPTRYAGLMNDESSLTVENAIMKFEISGDGRAVHQSQVQKVDYSTLTDEFLQIEAFPSVKEGDFIVGGKNSTPTVAKVTTLNGHAVSNLEALMRPGADSQEGFLGENDSLIDVLVNDNRFVVDESGLTHQRLAYELKRVRALHHRGVVSPKAQFTYQGRAFILDIFSSKGIQLSPFRDRTGNSTDFKLTNVTNGQVLEGGWLVVEMIERYGFYQGTGTSYRTDPKQILKVLDFIKP